MGFPASQMVTPRLDAVCRRYVTLAEGVVSTAQYTAQHAEKRDSLHQASSLPLFGSVLVYR